MKKLKRKFRKLSLYKKSLLILSCIFIIIMVISLTYVYNSLVNYERGDIDNYLTYVVNDIKKSSLHNNIDKYFDIPKYKSEYEDKTNINKGYKELLENAKMSYKKTKNNNEYSIIADDKIIGTVFLDDSDKETRLGLLTYTNYKIKNVENELKEGIFNKDIYINGDYKLYINDKLVNEKDLKENKEIDEYKEIKDIINVPSEKHYVINNLSMKPKIKVVDKDDNEVKYQEQKDIIYANKYFKTNDRNLAYAKLTNKNFDELDLAKKWSLFLTNDLKGMNHGFNILKPNLQVNTEFYKRAWSWATNVDIQFTSRHTLDQEIFTNVKVSDYTIYNDNMFSVKIYLEKNMTLTNTHEKRKDVLNEEFFFANIDNNYRIISIKSAK